jgi:DNA ligase 1
VKAFANLYIALDETTKTDEKVEALTRYFSSVPAEDAAWAVYFLSGRKPTQLVPARKLREWTAAEARIPDWLFDESYEAVGDLAETMALLLPPCGSSTKRPLHEWVEERLLPLRHIGENLQREELLRAWREMDRRQRFVWNKLITGGFRVGVSQSLVVRALSVVSGVDEPVIAHRLMGGWEPTAAFYRSLLSQDTRDADFSRPYPFYLSYPLEGEVSSLGELQDWLAEWKWDGIRAQLIRRAGLTFLWSRGEERITERFPELSKIAALLPAGTVIDGEIVAWKDETQLPFSQLQRRIGRKAADKKILGDVPVIFLAYDLLEHEGVDTRDRELRWRRRCLAGLIERTPSGGLLKLSPAVEAQSWEDLASAREQVRQRGAEGLMLKRLSSPYRVGRQRGDWWKWKADPFTVDAVLIYAQRGHGRRASLYSDYTFGVWEGEKLVPFAKAFSGLTDEEIQKIDSFVRENTLEKFGPVRTVKPELVFELAFEGIQHSPRHKSGVAVRFPRMARWRTDKRIEEADSLETVRALLPAETESERRQ